MESLLSQVSYGDRGGRDGGATGATPAAASHIGTDYQLKDACERSPRNTVVLDHPTKISFSETLHVNSGCTLVVGPNANLEVEARLIFAGLLDVLSTEKVDVKLAKTLFVAPSITLSLTGTGSGLALSETVLRASAGSLQLRVARIPRPHHYGLLTPRV